MKQVALYARVSSKQQAEARTIASQIAAIEAYAAAHEMAIPGAYRFVDDGVSGSVLHRPGLDRLRDHAAERRFDLVLCLSPDRLARKLSVQFVILHELERWGVEVRFLNQPELPNSAEAQFWQHMRGAIAEFDRMLLQDRMWRGRRYRLQQGQSVPHQAPYGYRYQPAQGHEPSRWVVMPEQARIVQEVFSWYAEGDVPLAGLAAWLNERQIPGPGGKTWYPSTLRRLLKQPAYKGTAYYGRTEADYTVIGQPRKQGRGVLTHPRYKVRPVDEWIAVAVPPLVSETVWEAVQERLQMNAHFAARNSQHPYLFRSLLVCDRCGYTLQARRSPSGAVTYRCTHGGKHCPPDVEPHRCVVREQELQEALWPHLETLLLEPERLTRAWEALFPPSATDSEQAVWKRRQATLQSRRQRLLAAYAEGLYTLEELRVALNPILLELEKLEAQLQTTTPSAVTPDLERFQEAIQQALQTAAFQTQQDVIRLLIKRIVVSDDAFTVELLVPLTDSCRLEPVFRNA